MKLGGGAATGGDVDSNGEDVEVERFRRVVHLLSDVKQDVCWRSGKVAPLAWDLGAR